MSKTPSKYCGHPKKIVAHLSRALEQEEMSAFPQALMEVVREHGVSSIAKRCGVQRETIYRALSGKQKPTFHMVVKVLAAVGVKLVVQEDGEKKPRPGVGSGRG
jgi:probable addiction module antidote protein